MVLFQVANTSMLPLVNGMLAHEGKGQAAPLVAALIIVPQLIVALLAPWVGQRAEKRGRKTLLLVGFAALPIRAVLFALTGNPLALTVIQVLDGITAAVIGVMTALVIADVTKGTGRFNLAQGMFGTLNALPLTSNVTCPRRARRETASTNQDQAAAAARRAPEIVVDNLSIDQSRWSAGICLSSDNS